MISAYELATLCFQKGILNKETSSIKRNSEIKLLERKIITFAQQFQSINQQNHYILYSESLSPDIQLLLNVSKEFNELITVIKIDGEEIHFTLNGINNKKDILFFEPIDLTKEIMIALGFIEKKQFGWFSQKETKFPVVYETFERVISKWNKEKKEEEIINVTIYEFYKVVNFENKRYKLKINWVHELQQLHFQATSKVILLKWFPLKHESIYEWGYSVIEGKRYKS